MYKCINGWTKEKMLEVVKARKFDEPCTDDKNSICVYQNEEGNRCAVGLFIPVDHEGFTHKGGVISLCQEYPDLVSHFPLSYYDLTDLQLAHDREEDGWTQTFNGNAKAAMLDWIEKNVEG